MIYQVIISLFHREDQFLSCASQVLDFTHTHMKLWYMYSWLIIIVDTSFDLNFKGIFHFIDSFENLETYFLLFCISSNFSSTYFNARIKISCDCAFGWLEIKTDKRGSKKLNIEIVQRKEGKAMTLLTYSLSI